jgi:hypothetical protein
MDNVLRDLPIAKENCGLRILQELELDSRVEDQIFPETVERGVRQSETVACRRPFVSSTRGFDLFDGNFFAAQCECVDYKRRSR